MNGVEYYIWFQNALSFASKKLPAVLQTFKTMRMFFEAGEDGFKSCGLFTQREINLLLSASLEKACATADYCTKLGIKVMTPESPEYPVRLARIPNPPAVLYVKGELPKADEEVMIGIVGARSATPYGHQAAFRLSLQLASAGAVVVSGGAMGIDSDAHSGALQGGGKTVAVLGCGIEYPYLLKNTDLRKLISLNGALVSEYPPDYAPSKITFPVRNRLISALSLGVVVIEAGIKSGSLITANHALEQGKDVFAVSGGVMSPAYAGANRLLRDGAIPVFSAYDILCEYVDQYPDKLDMRSSDVPLSELPPNPILKQPLHMAEETKNISEEKENKYPERKIREIPEDIDGDKRRILEAFSEKDLNMDELCELTGLPVSDFLRLITELELYGFVTAVSGSRYRRI